MSSACLSRADCNAAPRRFGDEGPSRAMPDNANEAVAGIVRKHAPMLAHTVPRSSPHMHLKAREEEEEEEELRDRGSTLDCRDRNHPRRDRATVQAT